MTDQKGIVGSVDAKILPELEEGTPLPVATGCLGFAGQESSADEQDVSDGNGQDRNTDE